MYKNNGPFYFTPSFEGFKLRKPWPENCPWPEPTEWSMDYDENTVTGIHDEEMEELLEIKEYFDGLVKKGKLKKNYMPTEKFREELINKAHENAKTRIPDIFPKIGGKYWNNGFDFDSWKYDLSHHANLLQIAPMNPCEDPTIEIRNVTGYSFTNENLLRQAFTRRAFSLEYGLEGCSEELEFVGDSILSMVVTKEIANEFTENDIYSFNAPFLSDYNEGQMTKLRERYTSKEALAARARELGIGIYINQKIKVV